MTPITKEQAVQLAREAGVYQCSSKHPRDYLDSELIYSLVESAYKLGRNAGLVAVSDAWSDAVHSDLENGVKVLNEIAAKKLRKFYPEICNFGELIESLKDNK